MKDHTGTTLTFIVSHEAYYARACNIDLPEVTVALYHDDDGTSGEFVVRWIDLGSKGRERTLSPQIQAFDDSWSAFAEINRRTEGKFLAGLENFDSTDPSPETFTAWLTSLGFMDGTQRKR